MEVCEKVLENASFAKDIWSSSFEALPRQAEIAPVLFVLDKVTRAGNSLMKIQGTHRRQTLLCTSGALSVLSAAPSGRKCLKRDLGVEIQNADFFTK